MKRLTIVGIAISTVWCLVFASLIWIKFDDFIGLDLNELGDFFAGLVAPLALFWIVLGYLQQGQELQLNTEALKSQQEELKKQVQETAVLASNAERQAYATEKLAEATSSETQRNLLRDSIDSLPLFKAHGGSGGENGTTLGLLNYGATVTNLSVESDSGIDLSISPRDIFVKDQQGELKVGPVTEYPFDFYIIFTDVLKNENRHLYQMTGQFEFRRAEIV